MCSPPNRLRQWRRSYSIPTVIISLLIQHGYHSALGATIFQVPLKNLINLTAAPSYFTPLECNAQIDQADCSSISLSSLVNNNTTTNGEEVVVPCGICAYVDYTQGETVTFTNGLNIQGKLYFSSAANVKIYTTHVFVQGVLEMDPPDIASNNKVTFQMFGSVDKYLFPIGNNAEAGLCDEVTGCKMGKKVLAVAGGKLNIHGLTDPSCPSWVNLQDLTADDTDSTLLNHVAVGTKAASCWNIGDTIFLTSPDWNLNNAFTTEIIGINLPSGEIITAESVPKAFVHATMLVSPDFAVEVASISRSIIFDADDDDDDAAGLIGGHIIIFNTKDVAQFVEGGEVVNFGQQGNVGRYPFHFHMCGDASGSILSKNVVHHSNQRCYVVHGSHNVKIVDNVAFEVFGHCYFTEDGIETGNSFEHNLGASVRKPANLISGENDDNPSVFWITNPENHWIENVASGSEHSGIWFDTRWRVRGASASFFPDAHSVHPMVASILSFRSNTCHSNNQMGMRYYSPGWRPTATEQHLEDTRVYRNGKIGHFIHNNFNMVIVGGLIADHRKVSTFFHNDNIRFENVKVIGMSEKYSDVLSETNSNFYCQQGLELSPTRRHDRVDDDWIGLKLTNIEFSGFGSKCSVTPMQMGTIGIHSTLYSAREEILNITNIWEDEATTRAPISLCAAMDRGTSGIAIHDRDGSLDPNKNGKPGFVVSNEAKMIAFMTKGPCTEIPNSCAYFCEKACLRQIDVRTASASFNDVIEMVITSTDGMEAVSSWAKDGYTDLSKEGSYVVALPKGSYNFSFRDSTTGQIVWPGWAYEPNYMFPPQSCSGYIGWDSITMTRPIFNETRCTGELLHDGDLENLAPGKLGSWQQNNLDLELVQPGAGGSGHALRAKVKDSSDSLTLLGQYLDFSCIVPWTHLEFSADLRLEDAATGNAAWCDGDRCPKATVNFAQEFDTPLTSSIIGTVSNEIDGWYHMQGSILLNEHYDYSTKSTFLKIEQPWSGNHFVVDNVSLRLTKLASPTSTPTLPPVPTISPAPTPLFTNLALSKPCKQRSTNSIYDAKLAVDGNTSGNLADGSITHTNESPGFWDPNFWMVDLQMIASISSIKLYNRLDCCKQRLNKAIVYILDYDNKVVNAQTITETNPNMVEFTYDNVEGTYVRIISGNDNEVLSLAEVEVYGSKATSIPTVQPTLSVLPSHVDSWPTNSPTESPSAPPSYSPRAPTTAPSRAPATLTGRFMAINNTCLVADDKVITLMTCDEIQNKQIWTIYSNGYIHNKETSKCLKATPTPILSNCPSDTYNFSEKYAFVYNKFHKTLIAVDRAKKFKAITYDGKFEEYLTTGTVNPFWFEEI